MSGEDEMLLEICTGTACYVLGGADLLELDQEMKERFPRLRLKALNCLGYCSEGTLKAPFIRVNGRVYSSVQPQNIWEILSQEETGYES